MAHSHACHSAAGFRSEVIEVATLTSVNALQASVAQAQQLVQQDQTRVNQDTSRLEQSQNQLTKDKQQLSDVQQQSRQASQPALKAATPVRIDNAIEKPLPSQQALPATLTTAKPQVNTLGQTIGKFINTVA